MEEIKEDTMDNFSKVASKFKSKKNASKGQDKFDQVLHEFKTGKLKSSSGKRVENKDQALAIAFSEKRRMRR